MALDNVIFPKPFSLGARDSEYVKAFQKAIFRAAAKALKNLPRETIPAGQRILRNVPARVTRKVDVYDFSDKTTKSCQVPFAMTDEDARTIPPESAQSTGNRWSGLIKDLHLSRGALYTCKDPIALANESLRYSRQNRTESINWAGSKDGRAEYTVYGPAAKSFTQLLVNRLYFLFTLTRSVQFIDLSLANSGNFYELIESDPDYKTAKEKLNLRVPLWQLVFDPVDYTASRPIGLAALLDTSADGVKVESAQHEVSNSEVPGINLVFGGNDNQKLHFLQPSGKILEGLDAGRPALLEIPYQPGSGPGQVILPGSVLPTGSPDK